MLVLFPKRSSGWQFIASVTSNWTQSQEAGTRALTVDGQEITVEAVSVHCLKMLFAGPGMMTLYMQQILNRQSTLSPADTLNVSIDFHCDGDPESNIQSGLLDVLQTGCIWSFAKVQDWSCAGWSCTRGCLGTLELSEYQILESHRSANLGPKLR